MAAFHRLGLPGTACGPVFDHLVALLRQLTGAASVTLALVDDHRAWITVGGPSAVAMPRDASPAAAALSHPAQVWQRSVDRPLLDAHPALAELAHPVTVVTVRIDTPDGHAVGALELAWPEGEHPRSLVPTVLEGLAEHVRDLLELHAEVDGYRRVVDLAPEPTLVLDRHAAIIRANPALTSLVGSDGDALEGVAFLDLVHVDDRGEAAAALAGVLTAPQRTTRSELRLRSADGRTIPCLASIDHLGGATGHVRLVLHDRGDRPRSGEGPSPGSAPLARVERPDAPGGVAARLAHDLNNLLGVMATNLSLAEESLRAVADDPAPAALRELAADLAELRTAMGRATAMTSEMLAVDPGAGAAEEPVDVVQVLYGVGRLVGRSMPEGVRLSLDVPGELPPVAGEARDLERALVNLVLNARDAVVAAGAPAGSGGGEVVDPADRGSVLLRARHLGATDDSGGVTHRAERVEVQVIDDGVGMDASTRARAPEPLFTTKGDEGNGMGLATVAAYLAAIGGTLDLDSTPGAGTTATLRLPVLGDGAVEGAVRAGAEVPVVGQRVLLVDPGDRT